MIPEKATSQTANLVGTNLPWSNRRFKESSEKREKGGSQDDAMAKENKKNHSNSLEASENVTTVVLSLFAMNSIHLCH